MSPDRPKFGDIVSLKEFRARVTAEPLADEERRAIVDQAIVVLRDCYVHIDQKETTYGVDPLGKLSQLRERLDPTVTDAEFHRELVAIFTSLRDLHTAYVLPSAFHERVAFLPFEIEACGARYLVTRTLDDKIPVGAEAIIYNGEPIERAVEAEAERSAGANDAARKARGIARLTSRYVAEGYLPEEDKVGITFRIGDERVTRRREWHVGTLRGPAKQADRPSDAGILRWGADRAAEMRRTARTALFAKPAAESPWRWRDPNGRMAYRLIDNRYGYLRIYSFRADHEDEFLSDVVRQLEPKPPEAGLIVDIRGNPGGLITASEGLLRLLTGREIEPQGYEFLASPLTRALAWSVGEFRRWKDLVDDALSTGDRHTAARPLVSNVVYKRIVQRQQGPVVVIVDATSYSAADMFAAAFQDAGVGKVLSTTPCTGAGGAAVVSHSDLIECLKNVGDAFGDLQLRPLPSKASFFVSLRRCTRGGRPLEDRGVRPDVPVHELTEADLFKDNQDLIAAAIPLLDAQSPFQPRLKAHLNRNVDFDQESLTIATQNVDHVELDQEFRGASWSSSVPDDQIVRASFAEYGAHFYAGMEPRLIGKKNGVRVVNTPWPP